VTLGPRALAHEGRRILWLFSSGVKAQNGCNGCFVQVPRAFRYTGPTMLRGNPTPVFVRLAKALRVALSTMGLAWRSSPPLTMFLFALTLVGGVIPVGEAYAAKRIIDAIVTGRTGETLTWVQFEIAFVVTRSIVQRARALARSLLGGRLSVDVSQMILKKAIGADFSLFENAGFYDRLHRARSEASMRPPAVVSQTADLVEGLVMLAGYTALMVQFSPWVIGLIALATAPATIAEIIYSARLFRMRNWRAPDTRRLVYLESLLANDRHAKEVRTFGLGEELLGRHRALSERMRLDDRRLYWQRALVTQGLSFLGTAAFYGVYISIVLLTISGRFTLGTMAMQIAILGQGQQGFQSVLGAIGDIYEHNLYLSNLFEYLAMPTSSEERPTALLSPPPTNAAEASFVLEDVGFRHPGAPTWAIRHLNLRVSRGESVALVGPNGAGKTTLVKLLSGLYSPSEGRILLNGRDLSGYSPTELRERVAVLFQDFNQYQLSARDNLVLGSIAHRQDDRRLGRAIEQGGAAELVQRLAHGLETVLGTWFAEGRELSGGQWQTIALSRVFMREEAEVLILDEPTAALDPEREQAVFERVRATAEGKTIVIISHRFSTVRKASKIVVLENGVILEEGKHEDLVAAGGMYARMFAIQSAGYR
jgi:ATP-binding cassette, subfamily B, bacterial